MTWTARRLGPTVAVAAALVLGGTVTAPAALADPTPSPDPSTSAPAPGPTPTTPADPAPPTADPTGDPTGPADAERRQDRLRLPMHKGDAGDYVEVLQDRLAWMGYDLGRREPRTQQYGARTKSAVRAFQVKFFMDPSGRVNTRTWKSLKSLAEPLDTVPRTCRTGTVLCVDKTQKVLRYLRGGRVQLTLDARFGASSTPTREGVFSVFSKSRDHWSSLYGSWMPFAMFFSGGQAVHYSPYFARDGYYGASHGCIGVRNIKAAEWLFDRIPLGARVVVYRS